MPEMTSVKIFVVATTLALLGVNNVWMGLLYGQALLFVPAAAFMVASIGLWMRKPWSRFVIYGVCALTIVRMMFLLSQLVSYGWPYDRLDRTVLVIIPIIIIFLIAVWMIAVTHEHFKFNAAEPIDGRPQEVQKS